jgi:hypothetical protein
MLFDGGNKRFKDRSLHNHTLCSHADLTGEKETASYDGPRRLLDVSVCEDLHKTARQMSTWLKTIRVSFTHNRGRFATKLKDARLEMLGRLHRDYLADAVRSSELIDGPYQKS